MTDCIRREDIGLTDFEIILCQADENKYKSALVMLLEKIEKLPAADVRPVVRGKWNRTDAYPHRLYCSVCYKTYLKNDELLERWEFPLNYCPNCGAKMEVER